jgi:hypothetical protein
VYCAGHGVEPQHTPSEGRALERLRELGEQRAEWSTKRNTYANATRAKIRSKICDAVFAARALDIEHWEIAKALGVSRQQVNNYLHGHAGTKRRSD